MFLADFLVNFQVSTEISQFVLINLQVTSSSEYHFRFTGLIKRLNVHEKISWLILASSSLLHACLAHKALNITSPSLNSNKLMWQSKKNNRLRHEYTVGKFTLIQIVFEHEHFISKVLCEFGKFICFYFCTSSEVINCPLLCMKPINFVYPTVYKCLVIVQHANSLNPKQREAFSM